MKYIVFGVGEVGKSALSILGKENVSCFIDNDPIKQETVVEGKKIFSLQNALKNKTNEIIVIAVSDKFYSEIETQLKQNGVMDYLSLREAQIQITKEKIEESVDYINIYKKAIQWIEKNTIPNKGIINTSKSRNPYPEVTGYYIPTLLKWGYRELAITYAKWLCEIQKEDGSWYDTNDNAPYVFDSAQILKGLIAVRDIYPYVDKNIIKGCDWIISRMDKEGRLVTPSKELWGAETMCTELIHTYCLSPLVEAGKLFNREDYLEKAKYSLSYYIKNYESEILNFNILSHFYAYIVEAMLDMGEINLAQKAMAKVASIQKDNGAVPAYKNVDWVCSTGLFQFALIWYRLGDLEHGNKAFEYASKLQNESGGWNGSYLSENNATEINDYIPDAEISWAVKYFLDAMYYKNYTLFQKQAVDFHSDISKEDERYGYIHNVVMNQSHESCKVLDAGCGKGRFLKNLLKEMPCNKYYAMDISENVMEYIENKEIVKTKGSLTNIPFKDNYFDIVYTVEALEHAIDTKMCIKEMARVTKVGGQIIVVDKCNDHLGFFSIEECEQWFGEEELSDIIKEYCKEVRCKRLLNNNGLFCVWEGFV